MAELMHRSEKLLHKFNVRNIVLYTGLAVFHAAFSSILPRLLIVSVTHKKKNRLCMEQRSSIALLHTAGEQVYGVYQSDTGQHYSTSAASMAAYGCAPPMPPRLTQCI